jgi:hypothetical protein
MKKLCCWFKSLVIYQPNTWLVVSHENDFTPKVLLDDSDSVKKECQSSCLKPLPSPRNDVSNKFSVDIETKKEPDYKGGKESPDLNAGRYSTVSVHLELFRSGYGKHSSAKLTQANCFWIAFSLQLLT